MHPIKLLSRLFKYYIKNQMQPLAFKQDCFLSANPRFTFIETVGKKNKILIADKVLPEGGILDDAFAPVVIKDGIDSTLLTCSSTCREAVAKRIVSKMNLLKNRFQNLGKNISINYSGVSKLNKKYHLSIGAIEIRPNSVTTLAAIHNPKLIDVLDILVGNTCVLLDRNKNLKEARKNSKTAKFVTTVGGIEYRRISSFWLQSVPLASLVLGMVRLSTDIVSQSTNNAGYNYVEKLMSLVKQKDIERAIKNNDFNLAYKNFKKIEDFIIEVTTQMPNNCPITNQSIQYFHHFIKKGMDYWFKENHMFHWTDNSTYRHGIESFLLKQVKLDFDGPPKPPAPIKDIGIIKMARLFSIKNR